MRLPFLSAIFCVSFLLSCSKQNEYQASGTLTGPDLAFCGCCGGVVLTIDNQPGNYRVDSLPFLSQQQLYNLSFPRQIKFDFTIDRSCGGIEYLKMSRYIME
ncbi:MAG: hypothetical protein IPH18_04485 [Chitinophagaceae bacterium]|nr:hypothetical protein [Chitinophagaceae bacterium]MBK8953825.1 hypothetical protein [Chitinophagaceae bacterium]